MDSCDKVIIYKIDKLDEDSDKFGSRNVVECLKQQIINSKGYYSVIGLFGAYGEGKTTVIDDLREELREQEESIYMLYIDVWKYDIKDIESDLYTIYKREEDRESGWGRIKQYILRISPIFSKLTGISLNSSLSKQYKDNPIKDNWYKIQKENNFSVKVDVICFENLDRCSKEEKIAILSAIHKMQDWFKVPILVSIDPHAVDEQNKYFEDLIKKVFTTSIYLPQKTKIAIKEYIKSKDIDKSFQKYILSIYPVTPRDINYIINVYNNKKSDNTNILLAKLKQLLWLSMPKDLTLRDWNYQFIEFKKNSNRENALMAILHTEWRDLYHLLSQNPFYLQFFIESAQKNNQGNSYEFLGYTTKDAKRINKLLLVFYRSFDKFDIYEVCTGISPLIKINYIDKKSLQDKNNLENISEMVLAIISMQLEAKNYYEVKKMLYMCGYNLELDTKKIFLKCFKYEEMIDILFLDKSYEECIDTMKNDNFFDEGEIRFLLHSCSNTFHKNQNINLAKFILKIIRIEDISLYKREFSLILSHHSNLFLSFCYILEDKSKQDLATFIHSIYTDELYSSISKLETNVTLEFFNFFIQTFSLHLDTTLTSPQYQNLLVSIYQDKIFIQSIIRENLLKSYSKILSKIEIKQDFQSFNTLLRSMEKFDILATDKINIYYQIIIKTEDNEDGEEFKSLLEDFAYLLLKVISDSKKSDDEKIDAFISILSDDLIMAHPYLIENSSDTMRAIILQLFLDMKISKSYHILCQKLPKIMFEYLIEDDFDMIYEKFSLNNLGIYIINNSIKDDKFYKFILYIYNNNSLTSWIDKNSKYKKEYQDIMIELANINNDISFIDTDTPIDLILSKLNFENVELSSLFNHINNISNNENYKFLLDIDKYLNKEFNIDTLYSFLDTRFVDNSSNELKSNLLSQRMSYAFNKNQTTQFNTFYDVIFKLYQDKGDKFELLAKSLERKILLYGISSEITFEIIDEW